MKILWIAPIPAPNFKSVVHPAPWITSLAKELIKNKDIELTIIIWSNSVADKISYLEHHSIKYIILKQYNYYLDIVSLFYLRIKQLKKVIKEIYIKYDIIHIHGIEHQYELSVIGINKPHVISIQGILSECFPFMSFAHPKTKIFMYLGKLYENKYLSSFNNFSCRTKWDSNFIRTKNPSSNITMVNEMLREEFYDNEIIKKGKNILFLGGSNPIKGIKEALIAFNEIIPSMDNVKLIVLGICQKKRINKIIKQNNLKRINNNVEFRGLLDAHGVIKSMKESFCLLHPTYIDNSPNSICEAQLVGLPVIASDVGGVSSLIRNMETGILTSLDISDIAYNIIKLNKNDKLWKEISINSIAVAEKRHDKNTIINDTLNMYQKLIDN